MAEAGFVKMDPDVQEWESLSADERKLYSHMMEVFAGFLTHKYFHYGHPLNPRASGNPDSTPPANDTNQASISIAQRMFHLVRD